jgi:Tfp pilus assembly protein PilN
MSTLVLPQSPAPAPDPMYTTSGPVRFVTITADLLPEELIASRRLADLKRKVVIGLAALVVLLIAGYGLSMWSTSRSKSDLASAQHQAITLQNQQKQYTPLVSAQAQATQISTALHQMMTGDLQWKDMLAKLRTAAKNGVTVDTISGTVTAGVAAGQAGTTAGLGVLNQTGKQQVGTLTLGGTAPDKNAVATFVDTLTKVKGLAAAFPASVTGGGTAGKYTYSVSVIITSDALGGRYATTTGGK